MTLGTFALNFLEPFPEVFLGSIFFPKMGNCHHLLNSSSRVAFFRNHGTQMKNNRIICRRCDSTKKVDFSSMIKCDNYDLKVSLPNSNLSK